MDLEELLATRLLVQGNSGSGKSHLLRRLLEQSAPWVQQCVIDPEGDFVTLADKYGHQVVDAARTEAELQRTAEGRRARDGEDVADLLRVLGPLGIADIVGRSTMDEGGVRAALDALVETRQVIPVQVAGEARWAVVEDAARLRDALGADAAGGAGRVDARAEQRLADIDVAQARDDPLVQQRRLDRHPSPPERRRRRRVRRSRASCGDTVPARWKNGRRVHALDALFHFHGQVWARHFWSYAPIRTGLGQLVRATPGLTETGGYLLKRQRR